MTTEQYKSVIMAGLRNGWIALPPKSSIDEAKRAAKDKRNAWMRAYKKRKRMEGKYDW